MARFNDDPIQLGEWMLKKTGAVIALMAMLAMSALLMSCGSGSDRPSGLLYVVSQSLGNISSYALDLASGDLSLITNNLAPTCPSSGACGLPTSIILDPTGNAALVLNQGFISGLKVNSDGSLSIDQNGGAAIPSGQFAIAMAPAAGGDLLFVISSPQNPTLANEPMISTYSTSPGSTTVTLVSSVLLDRVPTGISAITFTPSNGGPAQTLVFLSSNLDLSTAHNDSEVSEFIADSSGNLAEQSASPYSAQAPNPLSVYAVNTSPAGQPAAGSVFVYVGSQAAVAGSVSGFELCTQVDTNCTEFDRENENLEIAVKPTTIGQNPITMLADPTNMFLYIACNVGNNVYAFKMAPGTGVLTPLSPALEPTGAGPVALAIHPSNNNSNEFLYVTNNVANTIVGYTVNLTSGDLSNPMAPVIFTPGNPYGVAGR
jgi:hypothetical protein